MTSTQIVGLGVRLFAVWLVVYVLRNVPGMWQFNATAEAAAPANLAVALIGAAVLLVAVVLWLFPLTVAGTLIPRSARTDHLRVPFDELQSVAISLLGLWVLTDSIPSAFYWVFMSSHASRPDLPLQLSGREYSLMMRTAVELAIGVWLLFGARGLLGLLRWARTAGT